MKFKKQKKNAEKTGEQLWECVETFIETTYRGLREASKMLIRGENTVCFSWSLLIVYIKMSL